MYETDSDNSMIGQLDGNISLSDTNNCDNIPRPPSPQPPPPPQPPPGSGNQDKITAAHCLPTVATYNLRSLLRRLGA